MGSLVPVTHGRTWSPFPDIGSLTPPLLGLPGWTSMGEDVSDLLGLDAPGWSGTQGGLPFSEEKRRGQWRERSVGVGLGGEEGGRCDPDVN